MNVYKQAHEFTQLVERFIRSDLPEGMKPATETEVCAAMYALRAAIPTVAVNTDVADFARAWNAEAMQHEVTRRQLLDMAEHLRWALSRVSSSLANGEQYHQAQEFLQKYDEDWACDLPTGCPSKARCAQTGTCLGAMATRAPGSAASTREGPHGCG